MTMNAPKLQNFNMFNASTLCVSTRTKFGMSSFIRSKDMAQAPKCRNRSRDPDHAHLGDTQASEG